MSGFEQYEGVFPKFVNDESSVNSLGDLSELSEHKTSIVLSPSDEVGEPHFNETIDSDSAGIFAGDDEFIHRKDMLVSDTLDPEEELQSECAPGETLPDDTLQPVKSAPVHERVMEGAPMNINLPGIDSSMLFGLIPDGYNAVRTECVANLDDLLQYMVALEQSSNLTLSFHAYGIDPIVFYEKLKQEGRDDGTLTLTLEYDNAEGEVVHSYSADYCALEVDGQLYLSCVSRCTDGAYLQDIIRRMFEGLQTSGIYSFQLVGPRTVVTTDEDYRTVNTLRLNSYEMAVLANIAKNELGAVHRFDIIDGVTTMVFDRV